VMVLKQMKKIGLCKNHYKYRQDVLCGLPGLRLVLQIDIILDFTNFPLELNDIFDGFLILTIPKN